ncbi:MAG: hypothetical protein M3373_07650 [Gemmatimonadota bacterium]|nr:hypothetical protein [Gemmatimonadota bacterium]
MIAAAALVMALQAPPPPDRWFAPDKVKHFFVSAFIQSVAYSALRAADANHDRALAGASLTTAAFGIGKEVRDWQTRGEFSFRDLAWDAAGGVTVSLLLSRTQ